MLEELSELLDELLELLDDVLEMLDDALELLDELLELLEELLELLDDVLELLDDVLGLPEVSSEEAELSEEYVSSDDTSPISELSTVLKIELLGIIIISRGFSALHPAKNITAESAAAIFFNLFPIYQQNLS